MIHSLAVHIIQREAPRCSFYCDGHMPQPQEAGRVTDTDSHAFFCIYRPIEGLGQQINGDPI